MNCGSLCNPRRLRGPKTIRRAPYSRKDYRDSLPTLPTGATIRVAVLTLLVSVSGPRIFAADLTKPTLGAFDRYVSLTEARISQELSAKGAFLDVDQAPEPQRNSANERLRKGEIVIERKRTLDSGKPINVPDGMIHHWMGTVFIPGVTLPGVLALMQDYEHHDHVYEPQVIRSRLLRRSGDDFHIYYRFRQKKIITVVLDTEYDVRYVSLTPDRVASWSYATRLQEVENPGEANERDKPPDTGHGFMWRLDTFWRFEQKDGGVYIQCEAVSLSRDIPPGLGWMIGSFVESIPKESLVFTLGRTREQLMSKK